MIDILSVRGKVGFDVSKPNIITVTGIRGSGKSALLETFGEIYLEEDCHVFDLYGSSDGEALAWLRSKWVKEKQFLLLHGENVEVLKAPCEAKPANKLVYQDFAEYDVILSASPLYSGLADEYVQIEGIVQKFSKRLGWRKTVAIIVRESANLYFSRLKISEGQSEAKTAMIYLIRQSRHFGCALLSDTLRTKSVDIEIREKSDYLCFKTVGIFGLHKDFSFMYSHFKPAKLQFMPQDKFVVLTQRGDIGVGQFQCPPWHKVQGENILEATGIEVQYNEPLRVGKGGGKASLGDGEHVELLQLYAREGLSYSKISERMGRSTATVFNLVKRHNDSVVRSGFCTSCRRAGSPMDVVRLDKGVLKVDVLLEEDEVQGVF